MLRAARIAAALLATGILVTSWWLWARLGTSPEPPGEHTRMIECWGWYEGTPDGRAGEPCPVTRT